MLGIMQFEIAVFVYTNLAVTLRRKLVWQTLEGFMLLPHSFYFALTRCSINVCWHIEEGFL